MKYKRGDVVRYDFDVKVESPIHYMRGVILESKIDLVNHHVYVPYKSKNPRLRGGFPNMLDRRPLVGPVKPEQWKNMYLVRWSYGDGKPQWEQEEQFCLASNEL